MASRRCGSRSQRGREVDRNLEQLGRPQRRLTACLVACICLDQALRMPVLYVGPGLGHANFPCRPGSRETKMNRVSPRLGSRGRMLPPPVTRPGVMELGYMHNQTAAPRFQALQAAAACSQSSNLAWSEPGSRGPVSQMQGRLNREENQTRCKWFLR